MCALMWLSPRTQVSVFLLSCSCVPAELICGHTLEPTAPTGSSCLPLRLHVIHG
jgi:hypothetical protein